MTDMEEDISKVTKWKLNLFLYLTKHHAIKMYGGGEVHSSTYS